MQALRRELCLLHSIAGALSSLHLAVYGRPTFAHCIGLAPALSSCVQQNCQAMHYGGIWRASMMPACVLLHVVCSVVTLCGIDRCSFAVFLWSVLAKCTQGISCACL